MTTTSKKRPVCNNTMDNKQGKKRNAYNIQSRQDKVNEALNVDPTKEFISYLKKDSERQKRQDERSLSFPYLAFIPKILSPTSGNIFPENHATYFLQ